MFQFGTMHTVSRSASTSKPRSQSVAKEHPEKGAIPSRGRWHYTLSFLFHRSSILSRFASSKFYSKFGPDCCSFTPLVIPTCQMLASCCVSLTISLLLTMNARLFATPCLALTKIGRFSLPWTTWVTSRIETTVANLA